MNGIDNLNKFLRQKQQEYLKTKESGKLGSSNKGKALLGKLMKKGKKGPKDPEEF